jgi:hypothetical protein
MYLLIDREFMTALYKHPKMLVLDNLRHIECQQTCAIIPYKENFGTLTDLELRLLYKNMCGESFSGYYRHHLEATLVKMCDELEISVINEWEVVLQAMLIPDNDDEYYRYAPGCAEPSMQNFLFRAQALKTARVCLPLTPAEKPRQTPTPQFAAMLAGYEAQKLARGAPREARQSNPSTYVPPKGGSKTGRVWQIAEPIYEKAQDKNNWKAIRKDIISACIAEGINESTASVQFGKWRKTKDAN